MFSAILYDLYNFKNVKSTHGGVLLLVKILVLLFSVTFTQIVQTVPNCATHYNKNPYHLLKRTNTKLTVVFYISKLLRYSVNQWT